MGNGYGTGILLSVYYRFGDDCLRLLFKQERRHSKGIHADSVFDTIAAMLSALAIMPAVFAFGIEPSAGPSLMFVTIPNIFKQMPMGRLFAVIFFLSVCFAGITSLINMFEAVIESWQHKFKLKRNHAVLLCGALTLIVGLFMEEEARVGTWMDFITIIVVPFGAVLGAISIYYILGFDKIKEELEEGRKRGFQKSSNLPQNTSMCL